MTKVRTAEKAEGPAFLNVFAPCDRGWRYEPEDTMAISRLAVETALWPLYEVDDGKYKLNGPRHKTRPIIDYLESQGRFRHLLKDKEPGVIEEIQANVDREWNRLRERCGLEPEVTPETTEAAVSAD
ncbi:MAG: hypothetical protein HOL45_10520 [Chloroflexi bacterium]|nr:hypothetical protein [Chloroflexota bacterium]